MSAVSVPINIYTVTPENREDLAKTLKDCGVSRVFLSGGLCYHANQDMSVVERARELVSFFSSKGFETALWFSTVGHGLPLLHESGERKNAPFTLIKTALGDELGATYCPLDEGFRKAVSALAVEFAKTGPSFLMLDDDFRMSQRGDGIGSITCCCDRHLKLMSELSNEPVTLESVRNEILCGKPSAKRSAWIKAQGDGMRLLAQDIRKAVDKVAPDMPIALCSAWCNWNIDGADSLELAKILAGKNKPILRLHGAPYWKNFRMYGSTVISVTELERMLASFCKDEDVTLLTEGDVYPRPRYNVPAAHLEAFDLLQKAHGEVDQILKYMFDYVAYPDFESGYVKAHLRNMPLAKKLETELTGETVGVRIYTYPHLFDRSTVHKGQSELLSITPEAFGAVFAENGIPTTYEGQGICSCVFGNNVIMAPAEAYSKGAIIDLDSARALTEMGVDVGIKALGEDETYSFGRELFGSTKAPVIAKTRLLGATLNEKAEVVSHIEHNGKIIPTSYKYENDSAQKFFVLCFPAAENGAIRVNYARQQSLKDAIEWISGSKLPVFCGKNPYLASVVKRDGTTLRAALINCFEDEIADEVIELDRSYNEIRFIEGSGTLCGNKIVLTTPIGAYKTAAFEVK